MDPLSDLLSLLKPRSVVSGGVAVKPNTAIQWPRHEGIKCYAVASGQCWLSVDGVAIYCRRVRLSVSPLTFR
jgi:hypothetical protein